MRAVLVDDEFYVMQNLKLKLNEIDGIEVVGMYDNANEFLKELHLTQPDVVFLDVEMPKMDGFALLGHILETGQSPHIIFVTAYSQYAVKAFEIDATDYIVKPVELERLKQSLSRIMKPEPEQSNERIKIHCFRSFSIQAGEIDFNTGWKTKKAEELVAYLLCEKGKFVPKEKIAEDLWPETDGEKSQANLHTAYYYLKLQEKNKGRKLPIESQRGKMRFQIDEVSCDLTEFDALYEQLFSKQGQPDQILQQTERLKLLLQAADLYDGLLFADRYYSWATSLQQRCEMRYEKILQQLIQVYLDIGDEATAARYDVILAKHLE